MQTVFSKPILFYLAVKSAVEIVKAGDCVDEAMDIVAVGGRPLEAIAIEHLCGVVVVRFYPAHLVGVAQVVGHQRAQQRDEVGIIHHSIQSLLEFLLLHTLQRDARVGKAIQDIG